MEIKAEAMPVLPCGISFQHRPVFSVPIRVGHPSKNPGVYLFLAQKPSKNPPKPGIFAGFLKLTLGF